MTPWNWILFTFMVALSLAAVFLIPSFWRGIRSHHEQTPGWIRWFLGDALTRGYLRALPLISVTGLVLFLGGAILLLLPETPPGSTGMMRPPVFVLAYLALLGLGALLIVSVMLFNWPKWAVPPRFRSQPGAASEWRQSARASRRSLREK